MFALVYVSRSTQNFTQEQLLELLRTSHEKNLRLQVTGLLLYKDGNFMQLLEGEKDVVIDLYATIRNDTRHTNVNTLVDEPVNARRFPDWSMGFKNLNSVTLLDVPGYSDFLDVALSPAEFVKNPSRAFDLLYLFKTI